MLRHQRVLAASILAFLTALSMSACGDSLSPVGQLVPRKNADCLNFGTGQCSALSDAQYQALLSEAYRLQFNYPSGSTCNSLGNAMEYHVEMGNIEYRTQPLVYYDQGTQHTVYGEMNVDNGAVLTGDGYVQSGSMRVTNTSSYSLAEATRHEVAHTLLDPTGMQNYTDFSGDSSNGLTAASIASMCR